MVNIEPLKMYIEKTLGLCSVAEGWDQVNLLPYFLRDGYRFYRMTILVHEFLLMFDRHIAERTPAQIRKHMEQVRKVWDGEVIYAREHISAYNRDRMVRQQIPFVVPGNQLYLPMLAIDLREFFLQKRKPVRVLSPSLQALVLHAIYLHRDLMSKEITHGEWAKELHYTKMTMTRAFRDLRTIFMDRDDSLPLCGRALWMNMIPLFRSPVSRRRFCLLTCGTSKLDSCLSGLSALAHYSMLAPSDHITYCMDSKEWRIFGQDYSFVELDQPEAGCVEIEIWRYRPMCFSDGRVADPLSVYLSLQNTNDERVETALESMLEKVSWE